MNVVPGKSQSLLFILHFKLRFSEIGTKFDSAKNKLGLISRVVLHFYHQSQTSNPRISKGMKETRF